jgi:hypothetical protein
MAKKITAHVRSGSILLKKSFLAKNPICAEALVRSLKIYVRAHMSKLTSGALCSPTTGHFIAEYWS